MSRPSSSPFLTAVEVGDFPFQQSSPLSLRQQPCCSPHAPPRVNLAQTHDYNFSGSVYDASTSGTDSEDQLAEEVQTQEEDLLDAERRISGGSSISSFPPSVLQQRRPARQSQRGSPRTPTKHEGGWPYAAVSPASARKYNSPFRHPSSIKALQMRDEVMSETHSVLRHPRNSGSQRSSYSQTTSYSPLVSPTKRLTKPSRGSPHKATSNLRTEFPLVLLHCTLLSPTILLQSTSQEDILLAELLPDEYRKRWVALRDKLVADVEVQTRGILIPHPKEDYELLEERLLECLNLENPRIRHNHYFQSDGTGTDSGFESGSLTGDETDHDCSPETKCPECGRRVASGQIQRKWEIKVFAANGLMRAGAWAAAWQEMEKVDVEVRVWLPEELRRELEAKLPLAEASLPETAEADAFPVFKDQNLPNPREREIYGERGRHSVSQIDEFQSLGTPPIALATVSSNAAAGPDLSALMVGLTADFPHIRKHFLLGVLSLLVLFCAWAGTMVPGNQSLLTPDPFPDQLAKTFTTTIITTTVATTTAIVTATLSTEAPCPSVFEATPRSTSIPSTSSSEMLLQIVSECLDDPLAENSGAPGVRESSP